MKAVFPPPSKPGLGGKHAHMHGRAGLWQLRVQKSPAPSLFSLRPLSAPEALYLGDGVFIQPQD